MRDRCASREVFNVPETEFRIFSSTKSYKGSTLIFRRLSFLLGPPLLFFFVLSATGVEVLDLVVSTEVVLFGFFLM